MPKIHQVAATGFAVGAEAYVSGRPDYPAAIKDWLASDMRIGPASQVVELGAGTGKFTIYLVETGARVTAVEPVAEMRERISITASTLKVIEGSAEEIPLPDHSVDAVICAQAFHWFANEVALGEIRRVLKQGGQLGLIWNVRDESAGWVAAISSLLAKYQGQTPQYHTGNWRKLFPASGFGPLVETHFQHVHRGTADEVIINRVMSTSFMASLPAAEKAHVLEQLADIIRNSPELARNRDISFPYRTVACRLEAI